MTWQGHAHHSVALRVVADIHAAAVAGDDALHNGQSCRPVPAVFGVKKGSRYLSSWARLKPGPLSTTVTTTWPFFYDVHLMDQTAPPACSADPRYAAPGTADLCLRAQCWRRTRFYPLRFPVAIELPRKVRPNPGSGHVHLVAAGFWLGRNPGNGGCLGQAAGFVVNGQSSLCKDFSSGVLRRI